MKIQHIVKVIDNYEKLELFRSKNYYVELLKKEILKNFNYQIDLIEKLMKLFPLNELVNFLLSNQKNRPLTIRFNTIKNEPNFIIDNLRNEGVEVYQLKNLCEIIGVIKSSKIRIGSTIEYITGLYTIQGISSILPVISMDPVKNEKILDMAAAPGGKTTLISQIMSNSGFVVANDINLKRIKSLIANIHRLGIENTLVINYNALILSKFLKGFDKVLIDAPCSGTGIISHDNNVKFLKINKIIPIVTHLQKKLLLAAIDSCNENSKTGGIIVYSTCSILVEENECVIQYALGKRNIKIIPTGVSFGMPGYINFGKTKFDPSMSQCRRFFPHLHNIDGFFICKIQKQKNI
nr:nucleolar protein [Cryptomonas curvata]